VIGAFIVTWNDALPSDEDRNRLLKPLIPRLVGSRSTADVEQRRSYLALDWLVRVHTPAWLDLREDLKPHAATLRALAPIVDLKTAKVAGDATAAAWGAARAAAGDAARAAAGDAARAAAWAAAGDAAWAAAGDAAWDAAGDALKPTVAQLQVSALDLVNRMLEVKP
jgi:hypothetical protein